MNDAKWIKRVIQQEHVKPLEVAKDYVLEYEKREQQNAERLTEQVRVRVQLFVYTYMEFVASCAILRLFGGYCCYGSALCLKYVFVCVFSFFFYELFYPSITQYVIML